MISFLVALIIVAIVIYAAKIILGMLALPAPVVTLVYLLIGVIFLFWLLSFFGVYSAPIAFPSR